MRVFVTGASGFIGSAIVPELLAAGHQVVGLARSDASAQLLTSLGAAVLNGNLEDLDSLKKGAVDSEGVIHTAFIHDFSQYAAAAEIDKRAIEAIGATLAGSNRPFIITAGTAGLKGKQAIITEEDIAPPSPRASEVTALSLVDEGVRAMVIRLSPSVHDKGDRGFAPTLINIARQKGVSAYVGEGTNHWPAVHRLDAARLYRLMLERGTSGSSYHGVADEGIPIRKIAEVIGQHLHLPVVSISAEKATDHFGWMSRFIVLDSPASSTKTRQELGWEPTHPGLIEDLEMGHYFES